MGIQITMQRYDVQVLGRTFLFEGQMAPAGRVLDYLNTEGRFTFPLYDVKVLPISPGGPLKGITRPEIIVNDTELGLIYFLDTDLREKVQLLRNKDRVIVYTPHAILRGNFHRGVEIRLGDLLDMVPGSYLALTDVTVFPTAELPGPFPKQADLLIINRHYINLYHPE